MSLYTRLNLGAIPAGTAVHTKCRNCTEGVLVPRVTLSCNKRARDQERRASRRFRDQEMLLAMNFVFVFKIRAKIEIKEHL